MLLMQMLTYAAFNSVKVALFRAIIMLNILSLEKWCN